MNRSPDLLHMQQQAAARVREMEERSRRLVQEHPVNIYRGVTLAPLLEKAEMPSPEVCETPPTPVSVPESPVACPSNPLSALFGGDNEQLLLLLLAAVLAKNGAPLELLLALLYVAL